MTNKPSRHRPFIIYAWSVLAYLVVVILWGAFVRASGSGAGCGEHWPLCNGSVIQRAPSLETLIELSHRATSGISLFLVGGLVWQAFKRYPKGSSVRQGAVLSAAFLLLEAALGAGLVLLSLVGANDSAMRAVAVAVHLVNTFLLLGVLTYTAWFATQGRMERFSWQGVASRRRVAVVAGLLAFLVVGASGAVVALGDTLFKASSLAEGFAQDLSPTAHFLIRLRLLHPIFAVSSAFYLLVSAFVLRARTLDRGLRRAAILLSWLVSLQVALGTLNLVMLAPTWMQLIHLFAADAVWVSLVVFSLEAVRVKSAVLAREPTGPLAFPGPQRTHNAGPTA